MKNLLFILFFCSIAAISAQAQDENITSVEQYLHLGDSLRKVENKGDNARLMYMKAIALDDRNAIAYHKIAQSFVGDYSKERADNYLDSVIAYEKKPGYLILSSAMLMIGRLLPIVRNGDMA
jgi:Flp pilus assembly protein TadD